MFSAIMLAPITPVATASVADAVAAITSARKLPIGSDFLPSTCFEKSLKITLTVRYAPKPNTGGPTTRVVIPSQSGRGAGAVGVSIWAR